MEPTTGSQRLRLAGARRRAAAGPGRGDLSKLYARPSAARDSDNESVFIINWFAVGG